MSPVAFQLRAHWLILLIIVVTVLVSCSGFNFNMHRTWSCSFALLLLGGITISLIRWQRLVTRIRGQDLRVCLKCEYPLDPSAPAGVCPECGTAYELQATKIEWQQRIGQAPHDSEDPPAAR